MSEHYATFINNFSLPIIIETWQVLCFGLSEMKSITVNPREKIIMGSITGEWFINSLITDKDTRRKWKSSGYESRLGQEIGKFRNKPCMRGEYSWVYNNDFEIVYDTAEQVAIFSKK